MNFDEAIKFIDEILEYHILLIIKEIYVKRLTEIDRVGGEVSIV